MEKLTHILPQTRCKEYVRKTLDEISEKQRRKLSNVIQNAMEDVVILYLKTGVVFTMSKKTKNNDKSTKKKIA